jgi:hypothetical protein
MVWSDSQNRLIPVLVLNCDFKDISVGAGHVSADDLCVFKFLCLMVVGEDKETIGIHDDL